MIDFVSLYKRTATLFRTSVACLCLMSAGVVQAEVEPVSKALLKQAIHAITAKDRTAAMITVDANNQPRVRTVEVRPPDDDLVFWIATKPNTRKVEQLRANPKVTLYFNVDEEGSYVSVMGTATMHADVALAKEITWREPSFRATFWPDFPADYLLIRVQPNG